MRPSACLIPAMMVAGLLVPMVAGGQVPSIPVRGAAVAGSGSIAGRVTSTADGQPVQGVELFATTPGVSYQTLTDADGRFAFGGLPAGPFDLTANKIGYHTTRYGQAAGGAGLARVLEVRDGERVENVQLALSKAGVVGGTVIDERGDPVSGADVYLLRRRWDGNAQHRYLERVGMDRTDDRGSFRLWGVPLGDFLLAVDTTLRQDGRGVTYYPGVRSVHEARVIQIGPDTEIAGMSVLLGPPALGTLTGVVRTIDGRPIAGRRVTTGVGMAGAREAMTNADGSYVISDLPEGEYMVSVSVGPPDDLSARAAVVMAGVDVDLPLVVRPPGALRGRYVFEAPVTDPPPVLSSTQALSVLIPFDSMTVPASGAWTIRPDDTFEVSGLSGRYRLRPPAPWGWRVTQVRLGAMDVTDGVLEFDGRDIDDIEVVLTQGNPQLTGTVVLPDGVVFNRGDSFSDGVRVVVFAVDPALWSRGTRYVQVAARLGWLLDFSMPLPPPGAYLAVAVAGLERGEESNPDRLERLRQYGTPVEIVGDEPLTVNGVRLIGF